MQPENKKTALILGASGLVGSELLQALLRDERYQQITCFLRRPLSAKVIDCYGDKIQPIVVDFDNLTDYQSYFNVDHVYVCLGTTIKDAGSQDAFRKVDYEYVLEAARCAKAEGAASFVWVSSVGADAKSKNFYLQTKGQLQQHIENLGLAHAKPVEPSLLLGKRSQFRFGEWLGVTLAPIYSWLLVGPLAKYRPVHAQDVALHMILKQRW